MKLFELYNKQPLREDKDFRACIKLCESVITALEDFDYEPDPAFAGVKGVTRDTGAGVKDAKAAQFKQQEQKLNKTWIGLVRKLSGLNFEQAEALKGNLKKLAGVAQQKGFTLTPSAEQVFAKY